MMLQHSYTVFEQAAMEIGLYINAKKTEFVKFHQEGDIRLLNNTSIKAVDDFVYLGSNIKSTEKDIEVKKGKAWSALNKLNCIWKSNLSDNLKRQFFRSTVETVLLYGSTTWTLTHQQKKNLDGTYTRMLRAILNIDWKTHPTIKQLYGNLPKISNVLRERRMRLAGHAWRNRDELVSDVLLWRPAHGKTRPGRPNKTFIDQLADDASCMEEDLPILMYDRDNWKQRVRRIRENSSR